VDAFVDGSSLPQKKKLDELLAAHSKWLETADQKIAMKIAREQVKEEDELGWRKELLASDWDADEGRLVVSKADLKNANLQGVNLRYAKLQGTDLLGANLKGANLENAYLKGIRMAAACLEDAKLLNADLERADLKGTILTKADLGSANLRRAKLGGANLTEARLAAADLEKADLTNAILAKADLRSVNLKGAYLTGANLKEVDLADVNLEDVNLEKADLKNVNYEVKLKLLPEIVSLRSAANLETMRFTRTPHALEELRQKFKAVGYRQQEREITYALKRSEYENAFKPSKDKNIHTDSRWVEATFNYLLFELPVRYGLESGRALEILSVLIFIFTFIYAFALSRGSEEHGIWQVWPKDSLRPRSTSTSPEQQLITTNRCISVICRYISAIPYAFYFSFLSAFQIGWRELNMGNWIARIQPRAYVLQATGWVRVVSGIQSLLSVYLLAIWVLTYFGRPFE
jgi:uncharacterized protein YjbI with pentapeptide repeats